MPKILVVEDDSRVRRLLTILLSGEGYDVVAVEDGKRGLAAFRAEKPDLVITDIIMPEKEGIALIMEIRVEQPDAKIIAMSGGGRAGNGNFLKVARELGATDILAKPFDPAELLLRVARCLDGAGTEPSAPGMAPGS